jgi:dTDP-4-dehydrorhamnose 3,5-epimerase
MKFTKTTFDDLLLIDPAIFVDDRGLFFEGYNKLLFETNNFSTNFIQDNISVSKKNVVRGLHFQNPPYAQGKLVSVLQGSVMDVVVDIRKSSPTFGQYYAIELNATTKKIMYVPPGFAHGFAALEDNTIFSYKCTNVYNKNSEGGILYNDPQLNIDWKIDNPIVSEKDLLLPVFNELINFF